MASVSITQVSPNTSPGATSEINTLNPTFNHWFTILDTPGGGGPDLETVSVTHEVRRVSDNALMSTVNASQGLDLEYDNIVTGGMSWIYSGSPLVHGVTYRQVYSNIAITGGHSVQMSSSGERRFIVNLGTTPTASQTSPSAGEQVGTPTPTLRVSFSDPDSGNAGKFDAYQIQVRRVSDQVSFWDPGWFATNATQQANRYANAVYAGTALVNATEYEWRARVRDGVGLESSYTGWRTFTPQLIPNPPTSLLPSGLQNTLTPAISGVYNQGLGGTQAAFQYEIRQGTTTIYQSGDVATAIATGQNYGTNNPSDTPATPPTLAWGTTYGIRARSKDNLAAYSAWTSWQNFNTNATPTTPTNLQPNGAVLGDTTPTLSWVHNDADADAQTSVEIELYDVTGAAFVTGYNPKTLAQATLTHDVTETLVNSPPNEYQWRIRTMGLVGAGYGPWSSYATFTVAQVPVATVTEPTQDDVIPSSSTLVEWTFSGGSGTQETYRVRVYASDQTTIVYDSGVLVGTNLSHTVTGLSNGQTYYVRVTVTDTLDQEASSGYIGVTTSFTPPPSIAGLIATVIGDQS